MSKTKKAPPYEDWVCPACGGRDIIDDPPESIYHHCGFAGEDAEFLRDPPSGERTASPN